MAARRSRNGRAELDRRLVAGQRQQGGGAGRGDGQAGQGHNAGPRHLHVEAPQGFFVQSFAFTRGAGRGCVPLDVTVGGERQVHHVTLSLFAGSCAA